MDQHNKRISVVVPSYNHARFIERCLRSIFKQTRQPDELLIIDDGSSDDSVAVIERVLKDCPFPAEFVVHPNKGLCATLNEGLQRTNGDYFAYLGSDDLWLPEFLMSREQLLEANPKAVLGCGHGYLIDEHDRIYDCSTEWRNFERLTSDARPWLYVGAAHVNPTTFYRRSALETRQWNENSKLEDYELYLNLAETGPFAFDPSVLAGWRKHSSNTSRDLKFMLNECLNAQDRTADTYGWSEGRLNSVKSKTCFFYAASFEENGYKAAALRLYLTNLQGAPSVKLLAKLLLRLCIPSRIVQFRRRALKKRDPNPIYDVEI